MTPGVAPVHLWPPFREREPQPCRSPVLPSRCGRQSPELDAFAAMSSSCGGVPSLGRSSFTFLRRCGRCLQGLPTGRPSNGPTPTAEEGTDIRRTIPGYAKASFTPSSKATGAGCFRSRIRESRSFWNASIDSTWRPLKSGMQCNLLGVLGRSDPISPGTAGRQVAVDRIGEPGLIGESRLGLIPRPASRAEPRKYYPADPRILVSPHAGVSRNFKASSKVAACLSR